MGYWVLCIARKISVFLKFYNLPSKKESSYNVSIIGTIAITLDTYSHVVSGLQEAAALRFDEALTSTLGKELVENIR